MDSNSTNINRFKAQCSKFSGILSKTCTKPQKKLIKEMIYGIQCSKDVKISNISRSLKEPIALIKTENRLCRNLSIKDYTEIINDQLLRLSKDKITDDMVIAIDPGDIMKPYAKAMEKLCGIWDGSAGKPANGYHLCQVTGANLEHNNIVPMYCEAYSSEDINYTGQTDKLIQIVKKVKQAIGTRGTWAIDRAGDNNELIDMFSSNNLTFVTRLRKDRWLCYTNRKGVQMETQAERLNHYNDLKYKADIIKIENGKEETIPIRYGAFKVAIKGIECEAFIAVVVEGFGKIPMVLLTNKLIDMENANAIYKIVEIYLTRWKCDECYRYIKQAYNLEDVRVLNYNGIRNIAVFVHAIAYFTSIYMGISLKLKIMVQKIFILSKRFFGIPSFFNYAMADGIAELLKKSSTGIEGFKGKTGFLNPYQLSLFPDD